MEEVPVTVKSKVESCNVPAETVKLPFSIVAAPSVASGTNIDTENATVLSVVLNDPHLTDADATAAALRQIEAALADLTGLQPPRYLDRPPALQKRSLKTLLQDGPPNQDQVKRLTRTGMGQCQGRRCRDQVAMIEMSLEAEAVPYAIEDDNVIVPVHRAPAARRPAASPSKLKTTLSVKRNSLPSSERCMPVAATATARPTTASPSPPSRSRS